MAAGWFDPQTILFGLIERLGVSPADFQAGMKLVMEELRGHAAEKAAFKLGAQQMVAHFTARLNAQDAALARIEAALQIIKPADGIIRLPNRGNEDHVTDQHFNGG